MKFSCLQQDLLPALQTVSRSIGVRSTLPILDNIYLSTEGKRLKLASTNLEIGVIKFLKIDIGVEGEITLPAKTLLEIVSGLGQAQIDFELEGEIVNIKSGKFKATVNGIGAAEFPAIPAADKNGTELDKQILLSCAQVLFACAVDEGRPTLTGVLTDFSSKHVDFVATDGFRLAHRKVMVESEKSFKSLIPKRTFEEVLRVISEEQADKVLISTSDNQNQIIFTIGNTIVSSRLIEGSFPTWERIIPTQIISRVVLEKEDAIKAIKLAAIFAKNEANVLILSIKKDGLILKSATKELGNQENQLEAQIEGEELEIAFNSKFLQDAIVNCPSTQLIIEFSGALSSALIKPVGVEGLEYIVMPVRLS